MPRYFLLTVISVLCAAPAAQAGIFFHGRFGGNDQGSGHGLWGKRLGHGSRQSCFQASACGPSVCDLNPCERFSLCCEDVCDQCNEPVEEIIGCESLPLADGELPLGGPGGYGGGGMGGFGGVPIFPFGGGGGAVPGGFGGGFTGTPFVPTGGGFTGTPFVPPGGGGIPGGGIPGGGFSSFGGPTPDGGQVPEPASLLVFAAGTLGLALMRRRRR